MELSMDAQVERERDALVENTAHVLRVVYDKGKEPD
jgi:hypothetical protein